MVSRGCFRTVQTKFKIDDYPGNVVLQSKTKNKQWLIGGKVQDPLPSHHLCPLTSWTNRII